MERRPRPATATTLLPTLGALLAAGATEGCDAPSCGPERVDELRAHGPDATRAARNGQFADATREIAVALGLSRHTATRVDVAGAIPVTRPEPPIATAGEAAEVTVTPPVPQAPQGGIRPVTPEPPAPPPPPTRPTTRPHPRHISGGAPAVRPHPGDNDPFGLR